jgi:hypothetical protein
MKNRLKIATITLILLMNGAAIASTIENDINDIKNAQQDQATATGRAQASEHLQDQIDRLNNAGN